jgi:hypothetical protein
MFDLDNLVNAITADTKEEKDFVKYCTKYGLDPNLLHTCIQNVKTNEIYEIVGLTKVGKLVSIIGLPLEKDSLEQKRKDFSISLDIRRVTNPSYYKFLEG